MLQILAGTRARRALAERLLGVNLPTGPMAQAKLEWVAQQLERVRVDWNLLSRHARFDPRRYTRRLISRGEGWELLVCGWLPEQVSAIHDHGGSSGVTLVCSGQLTEFRYTLESGRPVPAGVCSVRAGGTLIEHPETVHRVQNLGREPVVSLHLYSPPMATMNRFEEPSRERERVPVLHGVSAAGH